MNTEIPKTASTPQDFKKKRSQATVLELPSGQYAKARMIDLMTFIREGNIPNSLLAIINETLKSGEDLNPENIMGDKDLDIDTIREMYDLIDSMVQKICLEPVIHPVPENEEDRSDDLLYVDEMEDQDKLYLFQWSSGAVKDLESFREESGASLAAMEKVSISRMPPEPDAGSFLG